MYETSNSQAEAQIVPSEVKNDYKQLWQNPEIKSLVINVATEAPTPGSGPQLVG